ncbi:MAG: hypothetical protein WC374_02115 [Phycisphaerae bacterium]|jgi:hypothetical protein
MKKLGRCYSFILFACVISITYGEVSTKVFLRDSNEALVPVDSNSFEYSPIMVGTELKIVIDSNVADHWAGKLLIEDDYRNYGALFARGAGYTGSILPDAGAFAAVLEADPYWWQADKYVQGFDLSTDIPEEVNCGDWFIIDYNAVAVGDANIAFYWQDDEFPPYDYGLIHYIQFQQVPTRDFDGSGRVDFNDFSILAAYWYDYCEEPNSCQGTNLDDYNVVDLNDLMLFTEYWLEKTK